MELIIQILMLFIAINCLLKLSFWKPWQTIIFSFACSVFTLWTCQYAITQSKTQLHDYLQNVKIMQDMAVLITIESVICFAFCFISLKTINGEKVKNWLKLLKWYPGLLIFLVLFYVLTQTIYAMPGTDFSTISYVMAVIVLVAIPVLSYFLKYLLPEKELKLEVYFLVSLFVCLIGLITTVNDTVIYAKHETPLDTKALIISGGLFIIIFLIGFLWDKIKWIIFKKRKQYKI
jgi:hypothetical protein